MRTFRVLPMALAAVMSLPVLADDKGGDTKATDEVKQAIVDAAEKMTELSHKFTGQLDVEVGGNPMFNTEMKGVHKSPYTKMTMDMMGQEMEMYTDGKSSVGKNPQTGEWQKQDGQNLNVTTDPKQMKKMIKSAEWEEKESAVGEHKCRVAKAKVDKEEIKKALGAGGMGMNATLKKSSLRFYIDKENGRIYRIRMSVTLETDMGQGGEGMEMKVQVDTKYTYSNKVELEIPKEVLDLLAGGGNDDGGDKKDGDKKDHDKDEDEEGEEEEGSGK